MLVAVPAAIVWLERALQIARRAGSVKFLDRWGIGGRGGCQLSKPTFPIWVELGTDSGSKYRDYN